MELVQVVIDLLRASYSDVTYDGLHVEYEAGRGRRSIYVHDIDYADGRLAWHEADGSDNPYLVVYGDGAVWSWAPITGGENSVYFECLLVEWYQGHLLFICFEKNRIYVNSMKDKKIRAFSFYGDELKRKDDVLYCHLYKERNLVRRVKLPELIEMEPLSLEECRKNGVAPETIGGLNDLSSKKYK
ncbi:hypothetical protein VRU48_02195 [Pedobacter sp. KR3-3]|uniref:Uncharacterized protein n=1 Tax=Pedobacter albus TaxID=3113905 RepID=A0ABU7I363_9SPHI|nr:hypothetical protein [Pedobacter sp. KR3-3]MEE1943900.1 hypothetical protein [Pedobacter sp. KR3-3]